MFIHFVMRSIIIEINKKKMERLTIAEIFINEIGEQIIKARPVKAWEQVEHFLNTWTSNIKDIAPHHPKATEEQIILILCFVAVNLETEYIPQMTYTSLWKKNKLNYNMYNDVLRVYFNFVCYNKVVRIANTDL